LGRTIPERKDTTLASTLRNAFSWSYSRHKIFEECRRHYFLQYYGSWNGWNADAPERARLAYRLKNMQSLPMWIGSIVHKIVERILSDLRNREERGVEAYQKQARDIMNREWKQSLDGDWMHKPKYNLNLFEHYYGVAVTAEECVAARDKVFACLDHFMGGGLFAGLAALRPTEWKSIEKLDRFVVNRQPVFVKIDCATRSETAPAGATRGEAARTEPAQAEPTPSGVARGEAAGTEAARTASAPASAPGRLTIYDWKTGKEGDEAAAQLGCYALYACQVWRVPLEEVELVLAYLAPGEVRRFVPTAADVLQTQDFVMSSMDAMIATLDTTADDNRASQENFPLTARRSACHRCVFREICFGTREWSDGIQPVEE
jgi:hypothetical protein